MKLVKVAGAFSWHYHDHEDEMLLVWTGRLRVEFHVRVVDIRPGEFVVVPHGVEHRTAADGEAEVLSFEPAGVRNTVNVETSRFTAPGNVTI